jgi:hypothetical protein
VGFINLGSSLGTGLGLIALDLEVSRGIEGFFTLGGTLTGFDFLTDGLGETSFFGLEMTPPERSILLPKNMIKITPKTDAIKPTKNANGLGGILKPRYIKYNPPITMRAPKTLTIKLIILIPPDSIMLGIIYKLLVTSHTIIIVLSV